MMYEKKEDIIVNPKEDRGGFWWGCLGFFVPIVGFILWLVWRDEKPKTAKILGIGALISNIIFIIFFIFSFIYFLFLLNRATSFINEVMEVVPS